MGEITADLSLPFFKAGDDLMEHIRNAKGTKAGLRSYASALREAAWLLERIANDIDDSVVVEGDTHCITVTGPEKVIGPLVEENLLSVGE